MRIEDLEEPQIFEHWIKQSEKAAKKDYLFLDGLLSYAPTEIDTTAQTADKEAFEKINCQNCANCCKQLKPDLEASDITRIADFLEIPAAEFAEDFDRLTAQHQCPFLAENNLCKIYEIRPIACQEFPNTQKPDFTTRIKDHKEYLNYCPATYYVVQRMQTLLNKDHE